MKRITIAIMVGVVIGGVMLVVLALLLTIYPIHRPAHIHIPAPESQSFRQLGTPVKPTYTGAPVSCITHRHIAHWIACPKPQAPGPPSGTAPSGATSPVSSGG